MAALREFRPADAAPFQFVFKGHVPTMETLRRDLSRAGIVYKDEQGRRADFHSLRVTFSTNLVLAKVHPVVAKELMRHGDIRQTMKCYMDVSQLPVAEGVAALPSFEVGSPSLPDNCPLKIING